MHLSPKHVPPRADAPKPLPRVASALAGGEAGWREADEGIEGGKEAEKNKRKAGLVSGFLRMPPPLPLPFISRACVYLSLIS